MVDGSQHGVDGKGRFGRGSFVRGTQQNGTDHAHRLDLKKLVTLLICTITPTPSSQKTGPGISRCAGNNGVEVVYDKRHE